MITGVKPILTIVTAAVMATVAIQRQDLHPHHNNSNNNNTHRVAMQGRGNSYCVALSRTSLFYGPRRLSRHVTVTSPSLSEHRRRRNSRGSRHRRVSRSVSVAEATFTLLTYHHHPSSLINLDSSSCWISQSITPRSSLSGPFSLST